MSDATSDAALLRALRHAWEGIDPVPRDLVDRMVAAVAAADLTREYALLTLVEEVEPASTRGGAGAAAMLTMQFSDGITNLLIHVSTTDDGIRRIDGWIDRPTSSVELMQGEKRRSTEPEGGRFAFDEVPSGLSRLCIVLADGGVGDADELRTPLFEV